MSAPPVALSIAGSDCSSGAGLQADLKTFSAFGVHGLTAVSAVVAETPLAVRAISSISPATLQEQIRVLLDSYPVAAIKTGMLGSAPHVVAVAELLQDHEIPLVVDPVLVASTGTALSSQEALGAYRDRLLPLASLVTPNVAEARALGGGEIGENAAQLADHLGCPVLLTGGHRQDLEEATDFFSDSRTNREFHAPWVKITSSHGTGCTLSSAITAMLAHGSALPESIAAAKKFVTRALRTSYAWEIPGDGGELRALNQLPVSFFGPTGS